MPLTFQSLRTCNTRPDTLVFHLPPVEKRTRLGWPNRTDNHKELLFAREKCCFDFELWLWKSGFLKWTGHCSGFHVCTGVRSLFPGPKSMSICKLTYFYSCKTTWMNQCCKLTYRTTCPVWPLPTPTPYGLISIWAHLGCIYSTKVLFKLTVLWHSQYFSSLSAYTSHPGSLSKCRFWPSGSGMGCEMFYF